jgi:hypothetical protein
VHILQDAVGIVRRADAEQLVHAVVPPLGQLVHADVAADLDSSTTLINAITASTTRGVRLPPVVETDRAGLVASLSTLGVVGPDDARVLRVTDTMRLDRCYASTALVEKARERSDLRVVADPEPVAFNDGEFAAPTPHETD